MTRQLNLGKTFQADDYFLLRAPLLPYASFLRLGEDLSAARLLRSGSQTEALQAYVTDCERVRQRLREVTEQPAMCEALAVSSHSVCQRLSRWVDNALEHDGAAVERTILKYVTRAASRCTPYGLLAGVALGELRQGSGTTLRLRGVSEHRRHVRADARVVLAVANLVARDGRHRESQRYFTNSTLYRIGPRLRYYEFAGQPFASAQQLVSVAADAGICEVVERARGGATWPALRTTICAAEPGLSQVDAEDFLDELIAAQVLIPDVYPSPHGEEMLHALRRKVARLEAAADVGAFLDVLHERAERLMQVPLGEGRALLDATALELESFMKQRLRLSLDTALQLEQPEQPEELDDSEDQAGGAGGVTCFQVDMTLAAETLRLDSADFEPVLDALDSLYLVNSQDRFEPMHDFVESFRRRYDDQEVPLCEALDPDHGIRFGAQGMLQLEPSPLLRIPVGGRAPSASQRSSRSDAWRAELLLNAAAVGSHEIALPAAMVRRTFPAAGVAPPVALVAIVSRHGSVADAGQAPSWSLVSCWGSHAINVNGRFAHVLGPGLTERLRASARQEQNMSRSVFADVSYLPPLHLANVCQQPAFRDYTIPYACPPSSAAQHVIPLEDLLVSVVGTSVVLRSRSLGVTISPRVDHALNIAHHTSPAIFNFLGLLQYQGIQSQLSWTWGQFDGLAHLPRVVIDGVVVSPQTWNLSAPEVTALTGTLKKGNCQVVGFDAFVRVQEWRQRKQLPRIVAVGNMADYLAIDLDNPLSVDLFLRQIRKQPRIVEPHLQERSQALVSAAGYHANELAVPIWNRQALRAAKTANPPVKLPDAGRSRTAVCNSSSLRLKDGVLYAKLYGGEANLDKQLRSGLGQVFMRLASAPQVQNWFFLRYADPDSHLRVRFFGEPEFLASRAVPILEDACWPAEKSGIWRLVFDAYTPELNRYGGVEGVRLAESFFGIDSAATLELITRHAQVTANDTPSSGLPRRWLVAAISVDWLLRDWGLTVPERHDFVDKYGGPLAAGLGISNAHQKHIGQLFRDTRDVLVKGLLEVPDEAALPGGIHQVLAQRSVRVCAWRQQLVAAQQSGALTIPWHELATNYLHMHCNRLFMTQQRRQEAILLQLLKRHYMAQTKRLEQASKQPQEVTG